jgi:predicted metal-dependent enzyme (double-stranded beta helix superfamily)
MTGGTMTNLEDAAAEIAKVRAYNDKRRERAAEMAAAKLSTDDIDRIDREVADRSMEIASILAALAAIEAGLPPGCCHATPAPGQE